MAKYFILGDVASKILDCKDEIINEKMKEKK